MTTQPESSELREKVSAEIHKCYCRAYEKRFGKPYWTNGDYSKLDEATKDYDREMADWHIALIAPLQAEIALLKLGEHTAQKEIERLKREVEESNKRLQSFADFKEMCRRDLRKNRQRMIEEFLECVPEKREPTFKDINEGWNVCIDQLEENMKQRGIV